MDVDRLTTQLVDRLLTRWGATTRRLRKSRSQSLALAPIREQTGGPS